MHFVTEEFLAALRDESALSAGEPGGGGAVASVWVEGGAPSLEIEVISDLGVEGFPPGSPATQAEAATAEKLREALVDRFRHLRNAFKPERPADLLVNCGDLVTGCRDTTQAELDRVRSVYADICLPAFRQLQEPDRAGRRSRDHQTPVPDLLSVPGNQDACAAGPAPVSGPARPDTPAYYVHFASQLSANQMPKNPESHPVATVFRIMSREETDGPGRLGGVPWACVAVIGFDSNDAQYKHPLAGNYGQVDKKQLEWSRRLITALQAGIARSAPLYVIAVIHHNILPVEDRQIQPYTSENDERLAKFRELMPGGSGPDLPGLSQTDRILADNTLGATSSASGFLSACQELRASLVLHANMRQRAATTLVSMPLAAGQPASELAIFAVPTFAANHSASGMTRIRLDLWKGEAEIAFTYDTTPDGEPATSPVQVIRPLTSASRVSSSERRLYARVSDLVTKALERGSPEHHPEAQAFAAHVAELWRNEGYAALSFPGGKLPHLGQPTRQNRYYLLLLLRETVGRNYEMLLSKHSSLRPSEIAEWDTLLMPAFGNVRNLMERLRIDVVRQVVTQAEDLERARSAKTFDAAVDKIQTSARHLQDDIWLDKIRELDSTHMTKISPTTGEITDYEYRLVVLTPFVRKRNQAGPAADADEWEIEQLRAEADVVDWLSELPSIRAPGASITGRRTIPLEAIMSGGSGLRWEPGADPDYPDGVTDDDARRQITLPPGAVWFPLPETGEPEAPWKMAPSITARNADVMAWIDKQLAGKRSASGLFPSQIVFGKMQETTGYELADGPFPFALPADYDASEENQATSTMEAMGRVEYLKDYDLRGQRPYQGLDIRRVALVRRTVRRSRGRTREVILVFDATTRKTDGSDLVSFKTCPEDAAHGLLGVLRPAQRYVIRGGMERAKLVNEFMADKCSTDLWGFLRATYGGFDEPITLMPPVVERVQWQDCDSDDDSALEFVVCDGNHRVVQKVWNCGEVGAAIGVISEPKQPYYARPFSPNEWDITAGNLLSVSPDPLFKYAPQPVEADKLSEEARREYEEKNIPDAELFRRYYRDLSRGFGNIGGQGGRYM